MSVTKHVVVKALVLVSLAIGLTTGIALAVGPFTEVTNRSQNPARPPLDFYGLSGSPYSSIAFVDIDGDGDQDAFGGHSFEDLNNAGLPFAFYKNVGAATKPLFELEQTSPFTPSFLSGSTMAFADMDKDGDFDLFVGGGKPGSQISDRSVYFYRNKGSKTNPLFQAENSYTVPNNLDSPKPLLVDINGDGLVDMFVSSPNLSGQPLRESRQTTSGPVRYYQNNGTGFTQKADADNPLLGLDREEANCAPFEDVDRDGDFDVICGTSIGAINYWENKGTKTAPKFELQLGAGNPFVSINVGLSSEGEVRTLLGHASPTFVDMNGDGNVDLVIGEQGGGFNYFQNTPDPDLGFYWPNPVQKIGLDNPFSGVKVWEEAGPSFADVNNDGKLDMFVGGDGPLKTIRYWTNVGDTKNPVFKELTGNDWPFTEPQLGSSYNFVGGNGGKQVAFADFNKDGLLEAIVGGGLSSSPEYWENIGTMEKPLFQEVKGGPTRGVGCKDMANLNMANPAIGDIDDDGDYDIIMGYYFPPLCLLKNIGSPTFPKFEAQPNDPISSLTLPSIQAAPALGDIDNDGDIDLLVGTNDGSISFFKNTGTKSAPKFTAQPGPGNPFKNFNTGSHTKPFITDIDGDYDPDVFVGDVSGEVQYLRNDDATPWPSPTPGPIFTPTATLMPGVTPTATAAPNKIGPVGGRINIDVKTFSFMSNPFTDTVNFFYQKLTTPTLPSGYVGIGVYYNVWAIAVSTGAEVQPAKPYEVSLGFDSANLPANVLKENLALFYKSADGTWVKEPTSEISSGGVDVILASPDHFSTWAILAAVADGTATATPVPGATETATPVPGTTPSATPNPALGKKVFLPVVIKK